MFSAHLMVSAIFSLLLSASSDENTTASPSLSPVLQTAGDNVTLDCSLADQDEQVEGTVWKKEDLFLVSQGGGSQDLNYADNELAKRLAIVDGYGLFLEKLLVSDTGFYTCQLLVRNASLTEERNISWQLIVQDVPSSPGQVQIDSIQSRQVTLSWQPSESDNNSPITNYIIQISPCQGSGDGGDQGRPQERVVSSTTMQVTVRDLQPQQCYTLQVFAKNSVGRSYPYSNTFHTEEGNVTEEDAHPQAAPYNFQAESISDTQIHIKWERPQQEHLMGDLKGYKISYSQQDMNYEPIKIEDPTKKEMVLQDLKPFTWYTVSILAYNENGDGPQAELAVQTLEGLPSSPRITHITGRDSTSFYVHWEPPKKLSGRLRAYELNWILDDNSTKTRIISGHLTNPMSAFISGLRPYTEYKIQVAAFTGGGRGKFSEKYPALTDVSAPGAPYIRNVTVLSPDSVYLQWDAPSLYYRRIDKYILKWWDTRGNDPDTMVPGTQTEYTLNGLPSNMRYNLKLAGVTQAIFSKRFLVGEFTPPVTFTLGEEEITKTHVVNAEEKNVIWDNYRESNHDPSVQQSKDDRVPTEVIIGVTCAVFLVVIVVAIFIGYKSFACQKCYQAAYVYLAVPSNAQSTPPTVITVAEPSEEKEYPEIAVSEFPAHVEAMHADSDFAFSQEFDDLYRHTRTDFKCEASNVPENRNKNRYINIAAFDHSRVMLKMDMGRRQSDYINANYVDGYHKAKAYIATQGPLPQTFADFWRMVWEQNCSVVVMITNLMEKGRRKCDQYWPTDGMEIYGNMAVKLLSTVQRAHYTVNMFSLRNMKRHSMKGVSERVVYQYHYTEWPDHGVPDYTLPVLEFVQKSAACNPPDGGPIVVHCSAGVGRTGTYILIDSMIRKIQDKGTINIPWFTLHIRRQRNLLVQTEDQYMFIHDVLVEYLVGGGQTEVTQDSVVNYVALLTAVANGVAAQQKIPDASSTLEKQFKLVTGHTPSEDSLYNALKSVNCDKNRSMDFIPVDLKRVVLPARPGIDGSDYINATYLQGYKKSDEFIVTQYPLESTKEDFWRMVWDRNSPVIIVLTSVGEEEVPEFWPEKDKPVEVDAGNFKLSMRDDPDEQPGYIIRDFILESIQYDYIFMTKVVVVKDWPGQNSPPSCSIFGMIETAQEWQRANDIGPVIVMDMYGGVHAGRFCALWTLREQLLMDKAVDIYQLAKLYHLKRPGIISSQEDLRYLYDAVVCLLDHLKDEGGSVSSSPRHYSASRRNGTLPHSSTLQSTTKTETNI
ncbi:tyrosine-protein phosphatase 99A-like isoform X2 [Pomacea canaliculata]|uniref:tyrosine-protein phosphatase 99A-like isoform X2 n=1 Tax=Pomacea canaliculata TaxID=400727 RepID=UPI000D73A165|nr:tyrosine-protein phosphatase 99A-like isoform X2 [Pomacea canaliculata]